MAAPVLLGLGLDEFSMSATSILPARKMINSLKKSEMEEMANKALTLATSSEVTQLIKDTLNK